jgi:hypothetical protein
MRNFIVCNVHLKLSGKLRWACHIARIKARRTFKILTGKSTGKILLGRPRGR